MIENKYFTSKSYEIYVLPKEAATGGGGIEVGNALAPAAPNIGGTGAPIGGGGCPGCPTNSTGWCCIG